MTSQGQEQQPDPRGRCPVGGRDTRRSPQIWLSHQGKQTLIATTLCADTQLFGYHTSTSEQCWHSPDLATEDKHLDPGRGTIQTTTIPTIVNSIVSVTKSLMSRILYAAPVMSNVIHWDAYHSHLEERSFCTVWSRSAQSCSCSSFTLFVPSGRARAITAFFMLLSMLSLTELCYCSCYLSKGYVIIHVIVHVVVFSYP